MKKKNVLYVLMAAIVILGTACKKDKAAGFSIAGKWELRQVSGMITTDYPPGNGNILQFSASGYQKYQNGQAIQDGRYTIADDNTAVASTCLSLPEGHFTKRIIYDNQQTGEKIFVDREGSKLTFISGCYAYDAGHTSVYEWTGE